MAEMIMRVGEVTLKTRVMNGNYLRADRGEECSRQEASRLKLACGVCLRDSKKADQRERREGERATQRLGTETCARPCIRVWT